METELVKESIVIRMPRQQSPAALCLCAAHSSTRSLLYLTSAGGQDLDAAQCLGFTPLEVAVLCNRPEAVRLMADRDRQGPSAAAAAASGSERIRKAAVIAREKGRQACLHALMAAKER